MTDEPRQDQDEPLRELQELAVDPSPSLEGRVHRDINRRTLAANSLEFSLNVLVITVWEHLRSIIDAWPGTDKPEEEDTDG